jgi:ubiquinone/menaquinone biosynthesis C-methylase UbiE
MTAQPQLQKIEVKPDRATRAYQDFLLGSKVFWTRRMYNELRGEFQEKVRLRGGVEPESFAETEKMMSGTLYSFFGWFERHIQRLKYSDKRYGLVAAVDKQKGELLEVLDQAAQNAGEFLRLNPNIEKPRYYTAVDFHQHPGGVAGDELAGFVYEYGRKTTTPNHIHEDDLHHRLAQAAPKGDFERILDFGCGVGKSTYPFKGMYPNAEVHGCDISAPCLKLAHLRAKEAGREIYYSQQNMEQTDYPDGYFDLIHTTFIQHEFPLKALEKITREAFRILKPGGYYVNLDFHSAPGGAFGKLCYFGHSKRNNEVFMRAFHDSDYLGLLKEIGFKSAEMRPFDDGTGFVRADETPQNWRFPWQLFVAQK